MEGKKQIVQLNLKISLTHTDQILHEPKKLFIYTSDHAFFCLIATAQVSLFPLSNRGFTLVGSWQDGSRGNVCLL